VRVTFSGFFNTRFRNPQQVTLSEIIAATKERPQIPQEAMLFTTGTEESLLKKEGRKEAKKVNVIDKYNKIRAMVERKLNSPKNRAGIDNNKFENLVTNIALGRLLSRSSVQNLAQRFVQQEQKEKAAATIQNFFKKHQARKQRVLIPTSEDRLAGVSSPSGDVSTGMIDLNTAKGLRNAVFRFFDSRLYEANGKKQASIDPKDMPNILMPILNKILDHIKNHSGDSQILNLFFSTSVPTLRDAIIKLVERWPKTEGLMDPELITFRDALAEYDTDFARRMRE
jgi:hypothetical protein